MLNKWKMSTNDEMYPYIVFSENVKICWVVSNENEIWFYCNPLRKLLRFRIPFYSCVQSTCLMQWKLGFSNTYHRISLLVLIYWQGLNKPASRLRHRWIVATTCNVITNPRPHFNDSLIGEEHTEQYHVDRKQTEVLENLNALRCFVAIWIILFVHVSQIHALDRALQQLRRNENRHIPDIKDTNCTSIMISLRSALYAIDLSDYISRIITNHDL